MIDKQFLDTNVVFYAYDSSAPSKQTTAQTMLSRAVQDGNGVLSAQVLGEFFYATVIRKAVLTADDAKLAIDSLSVLKIADISLALVRSAINYHRRFQLRYWDGLILSAAKHAGCIELVSEDFNDGQDYDGVRAKNPFKKDVP